MIDLGLTARPKRKPSLTPMIDVVFLLLVFFMLASRFGVDTVVPFPLAGGGGSYAGPPRLVDMTYREYSGGHDYLVWRGTLAGGLLHLFGTGD